MFSWWRRQAGRREGGWGRRRESKSGVRGESNSRRGRRRKGESGGRGGKSKSGRERDEG